MHTKLNSQSNVRNYRDIVLATHTLKKYFTYILFKEAPGQCALPKEGTKPRMLKTRIPETGYPAWEKDERKFQHESEWKARGYSRATDPEGRSSDWSKKMRVRSGKISWERQIELIHFLGGLDS